MRIMMQKTLAAAAIAGVCGAFLLMPGTLQAEVSGPASGGEIYDCYEDIDCFSGYECLYGDCVLSADMCQLNYSAFGDSDTLHTAEQSKTYSAASELLLTTLFDFSCLLQQTRESILESCIDGCCSSTCFPVTSKACTDGTAYSALLCQQEPCDYTGVGTWDVVCPTAECLEDNDCGGGYDCVDGSCEIIDNAPAIGDGPFVAAGSWPLLPTSQQSPMYFDQNYSVLWTFSDDYGSCNGACAHTAEYKTLGESSWTALAVSSDAAQGYAWVDIPVAELQNASTYAFRFAITDCASQTTQSQTYYFRVATSDSPPVITGGPYLAAGSWPLLPGSVSKAFVLNQNYDVLWTFSDDYASCSGFCTHRARYKRVDAVDWIWIPVSTDPTGEWYTYTELPVESLDAGTYQFHFDVRDCAGQRTGAPKVYYFKVE